MDALVDTAGEADDVDYLKCLSEGRVSVSAGASDEERAKVSCRRGLAVANAAGRFYALRADSLVVGTLEACRDEAAKHITAADHHEQPRPEPQRAPFGLLQLPAPAVDVVCRSRHVAVSIGSTAAAAGQTIVYDVEDLDGATMADVKPIFVLEWDAVPVQAEFLLFKGDCASVICLLSSGAVHVRKMTTPAEMQPVYDNSSNKARALDISSTGRLAIGTDFGSVCLKEMTLDNTSSVDVPGVETGWPATNVLWLSETELLVTYAREQRAHFVYNVENEPTREDVITLDIYPELDQSELHHVHAVKIPSRPLVFIGVGGAAAIECIVKCPTEGWRYIKPPEDHQISLPQNEHLINSFPLGLAVDVTCSEPKKICEETSIQEVPRLLIYTNDGIVVPYAIVDSREPNPGKISLDTLPPRLQVDSERTAVSAELRAGSPLEPITRAAASTGLPDDSDDESRATERFEESEESEDADGSERSENASINATHFDTQVDCFNDDCLSDTNVNGNQKFRESKNVVDESPEPFESQPPKPLESKRVVDETPTHFNKSRAAFEAQPYVKQSRYDAVGRPAPASADFEPESLGPEPKAFSGLFGNVSNPPLTSFRNQLKTAPGKSGAVPTQTGRKLAMSLLSSTGPETSVPGSSTLDQQSGQTRNTPFGPSEVERLSFGLSSHSTEVPQKGHRYSTAISATSNAQNNKGQLDSSPTVGNENFNEQVENPGRGDSAQEGQVESPCHTQRYESLDKPVGMVTERESIDLPQGKEANKGPRRLGSTNGFESPIAQPDPLSILTSSRDVGLENKGIGQISHDEKKISHKPGESSNLPPPSYRPPPAAPCGSSPESVVLHHVDVMNRELSYAKEIIDYIEKLTRQANIDELLKEVRNETDAEMQSLLEDLKRSEDGQTQFRSQVLEPVQELDQAIEHLRGFNRAVERNEAEVNPEWLVFEKALATKLNSAAQLVRSVESHLDARTRVGSSTGTESLHHFSGVELQAIYSTLSLQGVRIKQGGALIKSYKDEASRLPKLEENSSARSPANRLTKSRLRLLSSSARKKTRTPDSTRKSTPGQQTPTEIVSALKRMALSGGRDCVVASNVPKSNDGEGSRVASQSEKKPLKTPREAHKVTAVNRYGEPVLGSKDSTAPIWGGSGDSSPSPVVEDGVPSLPQKSLFSQPAIPGADASRVRLSQPGSERDKGDVKLPVAREGETGQSRSSLRGLESSTDTQPVDQNSDQFRKPVHFGKEQLEAGSLPGVNERNTLLGELPPMGPGGDCAKVKLLPLGSERDCAKATLPPEGSEKDSVKAKLPPMGSEKDIVTAKPPPAGSGRITTKAKSPPMGSERDASKAKLPPMGSEKDTVKAKLPPMGSERDTSKAKLPPMGSERDTAKAKLPLMSSNQAAIQTLGGSGGSIGLPSLGAKDDVAKPGTVNAPVFGSGGGFANLGLGTTTVSNAETQTKGMFNFSGKSTTFESQSSTTRGIPTEQPATSLFGSNESGSEGPLSFTQKSFTVAAPQEKPASEASPSPFPAGGFGLGNASQQTKITSSTVSWSPVDGTQGTTRDVFGQASSTLTNPPREISSGGIFGASSSTTASSFGAFPQTGSSTTGQLSFGAGVSGSSSPFGQRQAVNTAAAAAMSSGTQTSAFGTPSTISSGFGMPSSLGAAAPAQAAPANVESSFASGSGQSGFATVGTGFGNVATQSTFGSPTPFGVAASAVQSNSAAAWGATPQQFGAASQFGGATGQQSAFGAASGFASHTPTSGSFGAQPTLTSTAEYSVPGAFSSRRK